MWSLRFDLLQAFGDSTYHTNIPLYIPPVLWSTVCIILGTESSIFGEVITINLARLTRCPGRARSLSSPTSRLPRSPLRAARCDVPGSPTSYRGSSASSCYRFFFLLFLLFLFFLVFFIVRLNSTQASSPSLLITRQKLIQLLIYICFIIRSAMTGPTRVRGSIFLRRHALFFFTLFFFFNDLPAI